jgi:hypothetical protein
MARRPSQAALSPLEKANAFKKELDEIHGDAIFKELWFHSGKKPEDTLYRWWWEFMKANESIPQNTAIKHVGESANATISAFGELGDDFFDWWERTGKVVFQEESVPKIMPLIHDKTTDEYLERNGVPIFLPLGISRKLIHEQVDILLDHFHANQSFKRHASSTAKMKIFAKNRHRSINYDELRKVWTLRQQDLISGNERPLWKIFCLATGKEGKIAELEKLNRNTEDERNEYGKRCSELLQVAEDMMRNALLGSFPNDTAARAKKSVRR